MMLDPELLEAFALGFYGYGNPDAPLWFIGKEEAGASTLAEAEKRITVWAQRGRSQFDDVAEYHRAIGDTSRFDGEPKSQKTWTGLIRISMALQGFANVSSVQALHYQKNRLARQNGRELLTELLPLPSPSTGHWYYREYSDLPWLRSRTAYRKHVLAHRIAALRELIAEYKPKAVVFYSTDKWYVQKWESIAQTQLAGRQPNLWAGASDGTRYVIIEHPANQKRGITGAYFEHIGELLAE